MVIRRARRKGLITGIRALGVQTSSKQLKPKRKVGRPTGSYKYGMPIGKYKKAIARQKALYDAYRRKEALQLAQRGLTQEEIKQAQLSKLQRPQQLKPKTVAQNELEFRKFLAKNTVSPNTQRLMDDLERIQLKAQRDDVEQQRRVFEKRLLAEKGNLLKARNLFGPESNNLNILEVEGNILQAQNLFRENPEGNVLRPRGVSILNTREAGNDLRF